MRQGTLPITFQENLDERHYVVSPHNQVAYQWLMRWPHWPAHIHTTIVWGPHGAGKTHLSRFWGERKGAYFVFNIYDKPRDIVLNHDIIIYDNADTTNDLTWLFDLINVVTEYQKTLVLTMSKHPNAWAFPLPDLHSRLLKAMIVELLQPDDQAITQLLKKRFEDVGLNVDDATLSFIAMRCERDYSAIHGIVNRLSDEAARHQRGVTIPFVKTVFSW